MTANKNIGPGNSRATCKLLFEKQGYNYLGLFILLAIVVFANNWSGFYNGALWGCSTGFWFWLSIGVVIAHQFAVWFVWRTELYLKLWSRWFGKRAFPIWAVLFMILFIPRMLLGFFLGYANRGTLDINPILGWVLAVIILVPAVYTFYSIFKYFTFKRALGIDHFDPASHELGLVRGGIYRYTSNAMYFFAIMMVWVPVLIFGSKAALISALFNHAYVWVHYFTVELPDMKRIYSR
ncbi:methyltransferase [Chloroflexota bacterium]